MQLRSGQTEIARVSRGSSAWEAGLTTGDQLVAINGVKVEAASFNKLMASFEAGDEVRVSFFRRDRLRETSLELKAHKGKPALEYMPNASDEQKRLFAKWLGQPYPETIVSTPE